MKTSRCTRIAVLKHRVNYNLNNAVDKDVQSMVLPLNLMQYFIFCPKYRIKNNMITPNSLLSNCFSIIITLFYIFLTILCAYLYCSSKKQINSFSDISSIYHCIFYCIGFVVHFVTGIIQTKKHVHFVLTFQKIHRMLKNETNFNYFIIWTWMLGIIALGFYVVHFTYIMFKINSSFFHIYNGYLLVIFDFNIIYAARVIQMLTKKIELWNFHVLNPRELQDKHGENYIKNMFDTYVHILECYDIFKICFRECVSTYIKVINIKISESLND